MCTAICEKVILIQMSVHLASVSLADASLKATTRIITHDKLDTSPLDWDDGGGWNLAIRLFVLLVRRLTARRIFDINFALYAGTRSMLIIWIVIPVILCHRHHTEIEMRLTKPLRMILGKKQGFIKKPIIYNPKFTQWNLFLKIISL